MKCWDQESKKVGHLIIAKRRFLPVVFHPKASNPTMSEIEKEDENTWTWFTRYLLSKNGNRSRVAYVILSKRKPQPQPTRSTTRFIHHTHKTQFFFVFSPLYWNSLFSFLIQSQNLCFGWWTELAAFILMLFDAVRFSCLVSLSWILSLSKCGSVLL